MEIWVNVKYEGFEHYQISNLGNVRGLRGSMRSRPNARKYHIIGLRHKETAKQKTFTIHRLVAEHFVDRKEGKDYVNHIDGDKNNNSAENLEWVTQSENQIHAYKTNLQKYTPEQDKRLKEYAKRKRRPIRVINQKLGIDRTFNGIYEAAQHIECNEKTIRNALKNKHKSRLGYEAYYLD
uniref:HNH endonuclease signature motif containing protein n=1 Tax=uncultured Allobacillus sp. TaxID=1638025 RepID=UPI002599B11C|nr:HNH endonuclease signature motif containing protein [uncultured Allobacillus sp.]